MIFTIITDPSPRDYLDFIVNRKSSTNISGREISKKKEVVRVTGGSGYIGSWFIRLLLDRGYTVHATVKHLNDESEMKRLEILEGADSRLRLFQIDLLDYDSIVAAFNGCVSVFHLTSPCIVDKVHDPENELLGPAIKGTNNGLTVVKELRVRRVMVTPSVMPSSYCPADVVKREDCWTDVDYCKQNGIESPLSNVVFLDEAQIPSRSALLPQARFPLL